MNPANSNLKPVLADDVRWYCDPAQLSFEDTSELTPCIDIIGQERALEALRLGLELRAPGYNVFVCGLTGTGRMSALKAHLERVQAVCPLPVDRAYVFNFKDHYRPRLLSFPRGRGVSFAKRMEQALLEIIREVPRILNSDAARELQEELRRSVEGTRDQERRNFEKDLAKDGFSLVEVDSGDAVHGVLRVQLPEFPEPLTLEQLKQLAIQDLLTDERLQELDDKFSGHQEIFRKLVQAWHQQDVAVLGQAESLRQEICSPLVTGVVRELQEAYDSESVRDYLEQVLESLLDNLVPLAQLGAQLPQPIESMSLEIGQALYRYRVNVIVDNGRRECAPIVLETQPTFTHLFGGLDRPPTGEEPMDDFHRLRGGALLEADGGYLVLNAKDALREPGVWGRLKATLRDRMLEIPETDAENRRTTILKADPIAVDVKVILLGSFETYLQCLYNDSEFYRIFKVRVDFGQDVKLTSGLIQDQVPALIAKISQEEKLRPVARAGVALMIERLVRWAGRRDRMSIIFTLLADLIRESDYWAKSRGGKRIERDDVVKAIHAQWQRDSLLEENHRRRIVQGAVLLDLEGAEVGQVNGLVVQSVGTISFGQPVRITARCAMGSEGVVNIEREVGLSGQTHDKGVQILSGYLRGQYANHAPLSLAVSICFEQSYGGVDGDSASSTELYAILSAISGVPLRQDIAVSGSVNQRGEIQAVGGLNEKIEGFWRVVRVLDYPGEPGVIIPRACLPELMLNRELVTAIEEGRFRVYAIDSIDEGLQILTGKPVEPAGSEGGFPKGTFHRRVQQRLDELASGLSRWRQGDVRP